MSAPLPPGTAADDARAVLRYLVAPEAGEEARRVGIVQCRQALGLREPADVFTMPDGRRVSVRPNPDRAGRDVLRAAAAAAPAPFSAVLRAVAVVPSWLAPTVPSIAQLAGMSAADLSALVADAPVAPLAEVLLRVDRLVGVGR